MNKTNFILKLILAELKSDNIKENIYNMRFFYNLSLFLGDININIGLCILSGIN
jgi:hypothetical protein